jgi:cytochrome c peroxidase
VTLGRYLFYDRRLSSDNSLSCATCHRQQYAFSSGPFVPAGVTGVAVRRKVPAIQNVSQEAFFTWADPRVTTLERQARIPLFGRHPVEMGMNGRSSTIEALLRCDPLYRNLVPVAFSGSANPFVVDSVLSALASFERTLVSRNSDFDRDSMNPLARRGEKLFLSETVGCTHCHAPPAFSDNVSTHGGSFQLAYHNTGLYRVDSWNHYPRRDEGLFEITGDPNDTGAFRTPSLRNVAVTGPLMHDRSVASLEQAIANYSRGGRLIASGSDKGDGSRNLFKSVLVQGFGLGAQDRRAIAAFLRALTDRSFLKDPAFANPFRPSDLDRCTVKPRMSPTHHRSPSRRRHRRNDNRSCAFPESHRHRVAMFFCTPALSGSGA